MAVAMQTTALLAPRPTLGNRFAAGARIPFAPALPRVARRGLAPAPQALFTRTKNEKKKQSGYDPKAKEVDPALPAFTRRREVFAGRFAMLGFASALIGEILTGKGPIGQVAQETSLPTSVVELLFLGIIAYSVIGGLNPASPTFSEENQRDVRKRKPGPTQKPQINISEPKKFLGITRFGFSKKNEVFVAGSLLMKSLNSVGRTAQLGFLAALIGEKVTGRGILGQLGLETGVPLGAAAFGLVPFIGFFLLAAVFEGNYGDDAISEDETY